MKSNLEPVCRSDVLKYIGETITRTTWLFFFFGLRVPFTAEYNRRMQTGSLTVAGKVVFQWSCQNPADCDALPYYMTRNGQKFELAWIVGDSEETFDLRVNGRPVESLVYLDRSFQHSDDKV